MPPSETSIFSNFLLPPAPLPVIVSLQQFTELFPSSQRSNQDIPALYRELQHQRDLDIDLVKYNIAEEVQRGELQQRQVVKARRRAHQAKLDGFDQQEIRMEAQLDDPMSSNLLTQPLESRTLIPRMEKACEELEEDIEALKKEMADVLEDVKTTVGDLSDLRYGKFSRVSGFQDELGQDTVQGLRILEKVCNEAIGRSPTG